MALMENYVATFVKNPFWQHFRVMHAQKTVTTRTIASWRNTKSLEKYTKVLHIKQDDSCLKAKQSARALFCSALVMFLLRLQGFRLAS